MSMIGELSQVVNLHFYIFNKQDLSVILDTEDTIELLGNIDIARYDESSIDQNGEFHIVSSCVVGDITLLFVEDVFTADGILKYDETDVLFIPNYLPQKIRDHFVNECGYKKYVELNDNSTLKVLTNEFEN